MNRYHLTHVTEFQYDGAVSESYNEVRLRPMHDDRQSCLSFRLVTAPSSQVTAYHDAFGNWVHQFNVFAEHRRLSVHSESVVLAHDFLSNGAASIGKFQELNDALRCRVGVLSGNKVAIAAIVDGLGISPNTSSYTGQTARHCFQQSIGKSFRARK